MTRDEAHAIKPGDMLTPARDYNRTTGDRTAKLPERCRVLHVAPERNCQTGVMVTVESVTGKRLRLSAGWFEGAPE